MSDFLEREYKYNAEGVDYLEFRDYVNEVFRPIKRLSVSGYDTYYSKPNGDYLRHRYNSDHAELTAKRRLSADSTAVRVEVDLRLETDQESEVAALAGVLGYERDVTLYKTCHIFWTAEVNIVFYLIYDAAMNEIGRRIEIEANKDTARPIEAIDYAEYLLYRGFPAVVNRHERMNLSMFEQFTTRGKE